MTTSIAQQRAVVKYKLHNLEKFNKNCIIANRRLRESNPERFKEYERQRYLWKRESQTFRNILLNDL